MLTYGEEREERRNKRKEIEEREIERVGGECKRDREKYVQSGGEWRESRSMWRDKRGGE